MYRKAWVIIIFYFSEKVEDRKVLVKQAVRDAFGIRPGQVLQGHGTRNAGNLARRRFEAPKKLAKCLNLNQKLVSNVALILKPFKSKK